MRDLIFEDLKWTITPKAEIIQKFGDRHYLNSTKTFINYVNCLAISANNERHKSNVTFVSISDYDITLKLQSPFGIKWHMTDESVDIRFSCRKENERDPLAYTPVVVSYRFNIYSFQAEYQVGAEDGKLPVTIRGIINSEIYRIGTK